MKRAVALLAALFFCGTGVRAQGPWETARSIADFDRLDLLQPNLTYAIRKANELKAEGQAVTGAVECDVQVPETGWYELLADPEGGSNEFVIDGTLSIFAGDRRKLASQDQYGKVDNLWLTKGPHTIRIQRTIWWGFWPPARGILLRKAGPGLAKNIRVEFAHGPGDAIVRKDDSLELSISTAGRVQPAVLKVQLKEKTSGRLESTTPVELPAGADLRKIPIRIPCKTPGVFEVSFLDGSTPISTQDLKPVTSYVVDTTPVPRTGGDLHKTLVQEIDCGEKDPDYVSGGATQIVDRPFGRYRLSGDSGFLYAQHHEVPESWFAYNISTPAVGKPYLLEVDYPDDDYRTFLIAIRESDTEDYPVAGGVDSGGCWSLTNKMQTHSILFWPKTTNPRVAFLAAHNGRRAAAARIRVYQVDGEIPLMNTPAQGGRTFFNWYEEGSNFTGFYGGTKGGVDAYLKSAEMWPREVAYMGGNLIMPTVSVYQMNMYPSRYNHQFAEMISPDLVRLLLLNCEKFGVKLAAEFHPEARDLGETPGTTTPRENALVSKTGQASSYDTHGPMYHPLLPHDQEWYLGMIGEICHRYKDSPAFGGVSLRCMGWANPSLNNFHSLDWGYDDLSTWLFEKETGTNIPVPYLDPNRFGKRYDWLMANARERWIDWRCDKIADLYRKIVQRVRQSRPDLRVYSTVFDLGKEAGLDFDKLSRIDGLVLINARHSYGRRAYTYEGFLADPAMRDNLLGPDVLHSVSGKAGTPAFLFGAGYFEATEKVLKPASLGLLVGTKEKWISGVVNPAGRHCLERYAIALAETDARMLGDGGNAYTLGQPLIREFMQEYRRLPDAPFTPRADARDPVAVWELTSTAPANGDQAPGRFLFYAVNRDRYTAHVSMEIESPGLVRRLSTGEEVRRAGGEIQFDLQPYQLLTFAAPTGTHITRVVTTIPEADRAAVQAMAATIEKLGREVEANKVALDSGGKQLLKDALAEERQCLQDGRYWRARTLLENHRLAQQVYNPALVFPPGLETLMDPARARLVRASSLPRAKDWIANIRFDRMDGTAIPVDSKLPLQASCEGSCELREGRAGKALHLDGKTGRVVLKGDGLELKDFTLTAWVSPEQGGMERKGIVMKQNGPAGYALLLWNGSVLAEAGSAAGNAVCRTGDGLIHPGAWYHLAVTVESGKAITLYVNGEEVKKAELKETISPVSDPFVIGWSSWGGRQNDPSPGPFFGLIDDLKVWARALTADEVLAEAAG